MIKQLSLFPENSGTVFSDDHKYRFSLWKIWNDNLPKILFIGLNPSNGNEENPDPTIIRVTSFAKEWGFGGFYLVNLFTYITSDPTKIYESVDPAKLSDFYINKFSERCDKIVFAWGKFGQAKERAKKVIKMFPNAYVLYINNDGSPRHPLYVKSGTKLIKYVI
jgi:hypothetical protein